jgi:hypothetical protein
MAGVLSEMLIKINEGYPRGQSRATQQSHAVGGVATAPLVGCFCRQEWPQHNYQ